MEDDKKIVIVVDFDGVLHRYNSGWTGIDSIVDQPVEGALLWLREVLQDDRFEVAILSGRSSDEDGIKAMQEWLSYWWLETFGSKYLEVSYNGSETELEVEKTITWPTGKIPADVYIDDRAYCFRGVFPDLSVLENFTPWHKEKFVRPNLKVLVKPDGQVREI